MTACPKCGQEVRLDSLVSVDLDNNTITVDGEAVQLTSKEAEIAFVLVRRMGMTLTKEVLMDQLYSLSADDPPEIKVIDVFICKLRKKISGLKIKIDTVWGRGYRLVRHELA